MSYTYPDEKGQTAVDFYARRQIRVGQKNDDASIPILIASSGEGMAAENQNANEDVDWGFNQVTAVKPTDALAIRPYTFSSSSIERGNYVLVKKDLLKEQKASVIAAVSRPNEKPVHQPKSAEMQTEVQKEAKKCMRPRYDIPANWYRNAKANNASLFFKPLPKPEFVFIETQAVKNARTIIE